MINRAKRYGIFKELKRVADYLGLEAVEMPNPGTKFFPKELIEALGVGRKAPVKVGDRIAKWEGASEETTIEAIYRDLLGNEAWWPDFTKEHILSDYRKRPHLRLYKEAIKKVGDILKYPSIVLYVYD